MTAVLPWVWRLIARNFFWKVAALVIAIVIWAMVEVEPELATSIAVLMQYDGLPDGLEISSMEPASNTVTLEIRGPSSALGGLGEKGGPHVAVVLDMSSARPGVSTFSIGNGNIRLPRGLRMVRAIPSEARFEFEPLLSRRAHVAVRFRGEGDNGRSVAHYSVEPAELEIRGPASRVGRVSEVLTDPVDVSHVENSEQFRVNAYVNDPYVRFHTPPEVVVAVTMKKK